MPENKLSGAKIRGGEKREKRRGIVVVCIAVITTICAAALAVRVIPHYLDLAAARREMAELQKLNPMSEEMLAINPDYVGWIIINGTAISYPVVKGSDNEKYLNTAFGGKENISGTIFMDYRCSGEYVPHIILYGHNSVDFNGRFFRFGGLRYYLDGQYMAEHPEIMLAENNYVSVFEIFSARETDINDPAYYLDFSEQGSFAAFAERNGAPAGAEKIITLSTCVDNGNDDRRMIVQGVLRDIYPATAEYNEETGFWDINIHK